MERDKLLAELRALSDRGHGAAGYVPAFLYEQEILAEFDRLKAESEKPLSIRERTWDWVAKHKANCHRTDCPICNPPKCEHKNKKAE